MRANSHVRFGAGDEETCLGNGARRFIPTLPEIPAFSPSPSGTGRRQRAVDAKVSQLRRTFSILAGSESSSWERSPGLLLGMAPVAQSLGRGTLHFFSMRMHQMHREQAMSSL